MSAKGDHDFQRRRFLVWLEYLRMDQLEDEFVHLSDRAIARVFGVHHRLIQQARRGAKWQERNPLRRVWAEARVVLEMEEMTAGEIEAWDEAIRRGERDIVPVEVERVKALPPKPPTRADLERKRKLDAKMAAIRADFAAQLFGDRLPVAPVTPEPDPEPQPATPAPAPAPAIQQRQASNAAPTSDSPAAACKSKPEQSTPTPPAASAKPVAERPSPSTPSEQPRIGRAIAAPASKRKRRGLLGRLFGKPAPATGTVSRVNPPPKPKNDSETD